MTEETKKIIEKIEIIEKTNKLRFDTLTKLFGTVIQNQQSLMDEIKKIQKQ